MESIQIRHSILLVLTAMIWGSAFVAQRAGGDAVGPYTFNSIRSIAGGLALIPVIGVLDRLRLTDKKPTTKNERKALLAGGAICGIILFFASTAQQLGLYMGTTAGKGGFLTACYILIVPVLGIFLGKKCKWNIWLGVIIAIAGLYLLCVKESLIFSAGDLMLLLCALLFSCHILVIDYFSPKVDGVRMSCIQFFVCGILGVVPMFFDEMHHSVRGIIEWAPALATWEAWIPILYAGILSCGAGYTLQIVGQEGINPTIASLLLSLESVFSVISGWIVLNEKMGARELAGCLLICAAIMLAQIPFKNIKQRKAL